MSTITLTQFTDPFCTWCWGAEPIIRRIKEVYGDQVAIEFVVGGLDDNLKGGTGKKPPEIAPHWEEASQKHGMPVDPSVWIDDPPSSTHPSNVAFVAAEFQGRDLAHAYLRRMREAVVAEGRKLDEIDVLVELADEVGLDVDQFKTDFQSDRAREAFEEGLRYAQRNQATAFPTFHIEADGGDRWLRGYRRYEEFRQVMRDLTSGLEESEPRPIEEFIRHYGTVATQEVAEVYELSQDEATERLESLEECGAITFESVGNGRFWRAT